MDGITNPLFSKRNRTATIQRQQQPKEQKILVLEVNVALLFYKQAIIRLTENQ